MAIRLESPDPIVGQSQDPQDNTELGFHLVDESSPVERRVTRGQEGDEGRPSLRPPPRESSSVTDAPRAAISRP